MNSAPKKHATHKNVRSIVIGIVTLLAVSLAYTFIQKIRPRNVSDKAQQRDEPAWESAKDIMPAPTPAPSAVVAESATEQDKINAERRLAERATQEQKAAADAKLAAQRAVDDAKLLAKRLAEQQEVDRRDEVNLVPGPEVTPNAKTPELPKTRVVQKQTQKEPHSSRDSGRRSSTVSQSANRPAPAAPVTRPPSVQRPANNPQRLRSEFGPTAPGG